MDKKQKEKLRYLLGASGGNIWLTHEQAETYGIHTQKGRSVFVKLKEKNKIDRMRAKAKERLNGMHNFIIRV